MSDAEFPLFDDLPVPVDDGAADHLTGATMPDLALPATDGRTIDLAQFGAGRTILYVYPRTARPGEDLPDGWNEISGARGCTAESCAFRDHLAELRAAGAVAVHGVSTQDTEYQREAVKRLRLPFTMLADTSLGLADTLDLPTFETSGMTLYRRITLIVSGGRIEHVFYPVFPPDGHAAEVLAWLRDHPAASAA